MSSYEKAGQMLKSSMDKSGGAVPKGTSISQSDNQDECKCICERPLILVLCTSCLNFSKGRAFRVCPVHPNVVYFQDLTLCRECKNEKGGKLIEVEAKLLREMLDTI